MSMAKDGRDSRALPRRRWRSVSDSVLTEFYLPTLDDWYPCFEGYTVRVAVVVVRERGGMAAVRTSVWGADDTGMEREEALPEGAEARARSIKAAVDAAQSIPSPVAKEWLSEHGFVRA